MENQKIRVNMISSGEDVKGQGVGSAYFELIRLLQTHAQDRIELSFNDDKDVMLNHVHTVHPMCYAQMFLSKHPSCMHVHFLPETLEGSIRLPKFAQDAFYKYFLSMYKAADAVIVVNPIFIDALAAYGVDRNKITYIPNVVSSEAFYPLKERKTRETAEKFGLREDRLTVLGVGQVQTRKGVLDFLEVARALPEMQFIWAGGFSFGNITDGYDELKAAVREAPENVQFPGIIERDEMNLLYNYADVLLMTSYNELFPMSVLEAVNAGTALILRDLDLYRKIYFAEYLCGDSNRAFVEMLRGLAKNPEKLAQARAVSAKIQADYSEARVAQLWVDYYTRFAAAHKVI
uniref:glycosyltransferase family 4 protein n=1 Tax=Ndongobacter massiliensis TaxID=1871025 RepID=UPI000931E007|nr:glycosyltransferase family 4 protein [Ndongobacter massiliensis]